MIIKNIDNLQALWRRAAASFGSVVQQGNFEAVALDFSEWPNRIWQGELEQAVDVTALQQLLQEYAVPMTFTTWFPLDWDEQQEVLALGLQLKSTQIGMSLDLSQYTPFGDVPAVSLQRVEDAVQAGLWSAVFQSCFGYHIASQIINSIKEDVGFYNVYIGVEVVGCVATFVHEGDLGIHSLGVLSNHRRRGIAESIMAILLTEAQVNGLQYAHLQSSAMGKGVYQRLGFEEIFVQGNFIL